jgi:hypothetical protein
MIDPNNVPPITDDEFLARYVTHHRQVRNGKPELCLFMPYKHQELSVTRHIDASEEEIWAVGEDVSNARKTELCGRFDIQATDCKIDSLTVTAKPLVNNPNHADIEGWPPEKGEQKAIAQKIVAFAIGLIKPP